MTDNVPSPHSDPVLSPQIKEIGRPKTVIDAAQVFKLAALHATDEDQAGWFGISRRTFLRLKAEETMYEFTVETLPGAASVRRGTLREVIEQGQALGRASLRRQLAKMAETKPAAAIFLAKNILGYRDVGSVEITGPGGGPVEVVRYIDPSILTDEQLRVIAELVDAAAAEAQSGLEAADE